MRLNARVVAWVWAAMVIAGLIVTATVGVALGELDAERWVQLWLPLPYVSLALVIVMRRPGNSIAWLLFIPGTAGLLEAASNMRLDGPPDPVAIWDVFAIVWLNTGYFVALVIPMFLLFYIFPTGRFLTPRWRWAGWTAGVIVTIALTAESFGREIGLSWESWTVTNPIGFLPSGGLNANRPPTFIFGIGLVLLMLGAIPALVVRYRRSETEVRSQIKWVLYALVLFGIYIASSIFFVEFESALVSDLLFVLSVLLIPVSITVAVTRYNLYEIDRLISRSVSYVLVVATLALIYAGGAIWLPSRLLGEQSPLFVAGSTLLVAALFNPLRKRIQHMVDRRFNRSGYEAEAISEQFSGRLQETLTVSEITEFWKQTVTEAVEPSSVGVWLKSEGPTLEESVPHFWR